MALPSPLPTRLLFGALIIFILSLYLIREGASIILFWNGGRFGGISWDFPFLLDGTRCLFAATVCFISSSILSFGTTYIRHETSRNPRFWALVLLFIMSILLVIFTPRILPLIVGWDGLGMSRFLLVIHYHNTSSLYGGYITIISNRIGDAILLMVVSYIASTGHSNLLLLRGSSASRPFSEQLIHREYFVIRLLCLAAYSKRAQIPFNAWLPEAMAAPTPVRALVHSSTLVTAGIYVLIRSYEYWSQWELIRLGIWATGLGTIIAGGGKATTEGDVKKTIAYSTISQLGYMVAILGLGFPNIAFFHLITHALFKATIFMRAGVIFTSNHHYQGFDNWRGRWTTPLAALGLCISLAALNIFPFFAGIYSKEIIVNTIYSSILFSAHTNIVILAARTTLLAASTFTIMYTVRLWRGLYFTKYTARAYASAEKITVRPVIYATDNNPSLWAPFGCLLLGVLTAGRVAGWLLILPADIRITPWWIKAAAITAVCAGLFGAFIPCRGVTKIRGNQHVYTVRMKKKELTLLGKTGKSCGGYRPARTNKLLLSGLMGDWRHIHDGLHWFMDRTLLPFYRLYYLSGKAIHLLEDGILSLITTNITWRMAKTVGRWSRNRRKTLEALSGATLALTTILIILLCEVGRIVHMI